MFVTMIGIAALCAVNIWVRYSAHRQGLDSLPTGLMGS
jgi:hypothetical protein